MVGTEWLVSFLWLLMLPSQQKGGWCSGGGRFRRTGSGLSTSGIGPNGGGVPFGWGGGEGGGKGGKDGGGGVVHALSTEMVSSDTTRAIVLFASSATTSAHGSV